VSEGLHIQFHFNIVSFVNMAWRYSSDWNIWSSR